MRNRRRAVFVCCDGLGRDWVRPETTPILHDLAREGLWCAEHRAVFPSVTRVSAASVTTGCLPARHGLHGNRMGLVEGGKIRVRDVGHPDFRGHMRRATGTTLLVPSLAERVADAGGFIAFSNVSPGAAYFLDPEHFGYVYHRAGSYAPGGACISGAKALGVSHDLAGDWAMTQRFCAEVLRDRQPAVAVLWLANPDLTLHGVPLGSREHREALGMAERCVREVVRTIEDLQGEGDEILLLIGSDHGQETIGGCIDLEAWLATHRLGALLQSGDVAVAGQGTAALLYASDLGRPSLLGVIEDMRQAPWAGTVLLDGELAAHGLATQGGIVAAVNMARLETLNPFGVTGQRWIVSEAGKSAALGSGQHGGWGPDETRPFLIVREPGAAPGVMHRPTGLIDIAPTILRFLGLESDGLDGSPIARPLRPAPSR
ncbi:alkaline phosphatase family protein [Dongia sedimenti]|uniref:Alkaline phosphatase family protein n=1 Tax=Dongia sedimenti TaxID=3064282 RepID=A0ABU0YR51_9PROT|nr:alkaline phosphatase family protein [Rhodospirillaceae bacterium R-7]